MGAALSAAFIDRQLFPPQPKWSINDIPDQSGKVIIVTGGNTGIGKETVKALLVKNAKVYVATRNKAKSLAAIEFLRKQTGKEALFLSLDLADLNSVKSAAKEFLSKERKLHVLFNNAGVMESPIEQLTAQGFDLQFGVNVIGHWYFTELLTPALLAVSREEPDQKARVITTSSMACYLDRLHWDAIEDTAQRRKAALDALYNRSKHANVIVSNEVARRYGDKGIVAISVNPGNLATELQRTLTGAKKWIISKILYPAPYGALTQLYAGTDPHALKLNGAFMVPWARVSKPCKEAQDPAIGKKLWEWLEDHTKDV
ncbi:NAD(P)-binding protein [Irpex rosettiformis]|uniref:NAD(P)-binding protein n=1 Tax=Irpex rosettiformis TaxID=378272 RepID=A0ACB8U6W7_9APHY|nr:NAD(P)-binding protein [Irpex rosettiformis]